MKFERRFITSALKLEQRASDPNGIPDITGYAIVYNKLSENLGGSYGEWFEMCMPGLANESLANNAIDPVCLFNHDDDDILARRSAGRLQIGADDTGVFYRASPTDTSYARDLVKNIEGGNIRGSSFAFEVLTEDWVIQDGKEIRQLIKINLYDVSPVTNPAYPDTNGLVSLRSMIGSPRDLDADDYKAIYERRHKKNAPDDSELQDLEIRRRKLLELQLNAKQGKLI